PGAAPGPTVGLHRRRRDLARLAHVDEHEGVTPVDHLAHLPGRDLPVGLQRVALGQATLVERSLGHPAHEATSSWASVADPWVAIDEAGALASPPTTSCSRPTTSTRL